MQKLLLSLSKLSGNSLKYVVAAILIGVPLYPKFPFISIPKTQVSIRLEDLLIFLACVVFGLAILPKINDFLKNKISRAFFLFWAIGIVSVLTAILVTQNVITQIAILHWARRIEYMVCFFIAAYSIKNRDDLVFYLKIILLVVIGVFVYGLGQKYFNWPVITTQNSEYAKGVALNYMPGGHLVSTFAGHYDMASYLILVMPVFYAIAFSGKKALNELKLFKSASFSRFFVLVVIVAGYWLLVNAASRISIVSYIGSMSFIFLLIKRYKLIPVFLILSILFIGTSSNLIDRYVRIFTVALEKISVSENITIYAADNAETIERLERETPTPTPTPVFEDRSTSIRLNVEWPRAVRAFTKNPLLGTGYSSITLATDNDYLRMIGEVGLLGVGAFFLVIYRVFLEIIKAVRKMETNTVEKIFLLSLIAALPGIFLNMVFIDLLEASKFAISFWLMLGLGVGVIRNQTWLKK